MKRDFQNRPLRTALSTLVFCSPFYTISPISAAELPPQTAAIKTVNDFSRFRPQPVSPTKLDYRYLDYVLNSTVFYLGQSDRVRRVNRNTFNNGRQNVGIGHKSPYRMEGSRIYLKKLPAGFDDNMKTYREELQNLAISLPITKLSRDEQLAFWFNLHNVAVIELLSEQRRASRTTEKRFGINKDKLHDVKIIELAGANLSPRDIRENIVYRHWDDPAVMYGFFLGDLGGPALQNEAFNGSNLRSLLRKNTVEFVNSLRGFEMYKGQYQVSQLYSDVAPIYFPQFNRDLKNHFKKYMRPEVFELIGAANNISIAPYEYSVASISAGRDTGRTRLQVTQSYDPDSNKTYATTEDIVKAQNALGLLTRDYVKKRERLKEMGLLESEVTIEDIETEDIP